MNITYSNLNNKSFQTYYSNLYKINQTIWACQYSLKIITHVNNKPKVVLIT